MLIIKVGGSVFAPKKSEIFNTDLLKNLFSILSEIYKGQIVLIHGTGNIGHGFVNKYGVDKNTYEIFKKIREPFYNTMEDIFVGYKRIKAEEVLENTSLLSSENKNCIIGGDIDSINLDIISSDIVFSKLVGETNTSGGIIITDVPGVLDNAGNTIKELKLSSINDVKFWDKAGDVTDGMKGKIEALSECLNEEGKGVWIIEGNNLNNLKNIISLGDGEGTYVMK